MMETPPAKIPRQNSWMLCYFIEEWIGKDLARNQLLNARKHENSLTSYKAIRNATKDHDGPDYLLKKFCMSFQSCARYTIPKNNQTQGSPFIHECTTAIDVSS